MDKKIFLIFFYSCTSIPIILISATLFLVSKRVREGVRISQENLVIPPATFHNSFYISRLICGEDHRFYNHTGCDPIAIVRALFRNFRYAKLEGASTIEQQYVRTCTKRYEISFSRKLEEIAVSTILSITTAKDTIAHSYLMHAYYGHSIDGLMGVVAKLKEIYKTDFEDQEMAAAVVSLLKNPIPQNLTDKWEKKHKQRLFHINQKFIKSTDKGTVREKMHFLPIRKLKK